jgi:hypothetical protein
MNHHTTLAFVMSALLLAAVPAAVQSQSAATASQTETPKKAAAASQGASSSASSSNLYTVEDGTRVDQKTLMGWRTWRALACERCHGAAQEGLVGPPLVESMKVLSKEEFHKTLMQGRPEKGMPPFNTSKMVNDNWEGLYAYLKGRSDGKIKPGRLTALESDK